MQTSRKSPVTSYNLLALTKETLASVPSISIRCQLPRADLVPVASTATMPEGKEELERSRAQLLEWARMEVCNQANSENSTRIVVSYTLPSSQIRDTRPPILSSFRRRPTISWQRTSTTIRPKERESARITQMFQGRTKCLQLEIYILTTQECSKNSVRFFHYDSRCSSFSLVPLTFMHPFILCFRWNLTRCGP